MKKQIKKSTLASEYEELRDAHRREVMEMHNKVMRAKQVLEALQMHYLSNDLDDVADYLIQIEFEK